MKFISLTKSIFKKDTLWIEPGHFYSPITNNTDFQKFSDRPNIPDVDLSTHKQLELLNSLSNYYSDQPFTEEVSPTNRYSFNNDQFGHGDGMSLYLMLRHLKPKRVIEIGSGYSSAIMLDTNERFLGNEVDLTFIEPYPTRLKSLLRQSDTVNIIEQKVQDVDLDIFRSLEAGDILFIDSSHVSKAGSDVNWIYFEILPLLKKGVYIHVHDILYPFEYPDTWIEQGRSWNEAYIVKALLMNNNRYEIVFWMNYLHNFYADALNKKIPLAAKNPGGSIWIKKM